MAYLEWIVGAGHLAVYLKIDKLLFFSWATEKEKYILD